jgi:site-specific recombinase XerD
VQDGNDPVAETKSRREALTVSGLIDRYFTRYAKARLRTWQTYQAWLALDVIPVFGERRAGNIKRSEIADLLDKIAARAPVKANRVMSALSSVYSWALSEGLVDANPVTGLKKRTQEKAKERVLTD